MAFLFTQWFGDRATQSEGDRLRFVRIRDYTHVAQYFSISIYWHPDLLDSFQGSFEDLPALLKQLRENLIK